MTQSEFLKEMDAIRQSEPGSTAVSDRLASLAGWDSMAVIMFIAMADEMLGLTLNVDALASCETVGDLMKLCETKVA
jgi:acyl carrier protein